MNNRPQSSSFFSLSKVRKSGEQPNQSKQQTKQKLQGKKRPLAEINESAFGTDFPDQTEKINLGGQQKVVNSAIQEQRPFLQQKGTVPSTPKILPQKSFILPPPMVKREEPKITQPQTKSREELTFALDSASRGFKAPTLEEFTLQQDKLTAREKQRAGAIEILEYLIKNDSQADFKERELFDANSYQLHENLLQVISTGYYRDFQNCQMVKYLQPNLICSVQGRLVTISNHRETMFEFESASEVKHVFFLNNILYVSNQDELMYLRLSDSNHQGMKIDKKESIALAADKVINCSAVVGEKLWIGSSVAEELTVETRKSGILFCKGSDELKVKLPTKTLFKSLISIPFFASKNRVTQQYDLPEIGLAAAFMQHSSKQKLSEVQLFHRGSLKQCGFFTLDWLAQQIQIFFVEQKLEFRHLDAITLTILDIRATFQKEKQERFLIVTFSNGVRVQLYVAPPRQQSNQSKQIPMIQEDDISVYSVEPSPIEGCLEQFDRLTNIVGLNQHGTPLLAVKEPLKLLFPFTNDLSQAPFAILKYRHQNSLEVFVVEQESKLFMITLLRQASQQLATITLVKGQIFFEVIVESSNFGQTIKLITELGIEVFHQKTLRDHLGSYLILASQINGGFDRCPQLKEHFESLLRQYPTSEILAILIDFCTSDPIYSQPIFHDKRVEMYYFANNQLLSAFTSVKISPEVKAVCFEQFEGLVKFLRDQQDQKKWQVVGVIILDVLRTKFNRLLVSFPFKTGKESISPELLKEQILYIQSIEKFISWLKCEESNQVSQFCQRVGEVSIFLFIALRSMEFDISILIGGLELEDQQLIQSIQFQDLVGLGLESEGLQIFLENFLAIKNADQDAHLQIRKNCCGQFLIIDFFNLSIARQKLMRTDSNQEDIRKAVNALCTHIEKTELYATFDLLMENMEFYGINPSITYLKCYVDTKFVLLQWATIQGAKNNFNLGLIEDMRDQAKEILLEMVEELIVRLDGKSKTHPKSQINGITKFRSKLNKVNNMDQIRNALKYLLLRFEEIDDENLQKSLIDLLHKSNMTQYLRCNNSSNLLSYFQDKVGVAGQSAEDIQITVDNLIKLNEYQQCAAFIIDQIGSSKNFSTVKRLTSLSLPLSTRIALLSKVQVCFDQMDNSAQKKSLQNEVNEFRQLLQVQQQVLKALKTAKAREPSEEDKFEINKLQTLVYTTDEILNCCETNLLFVELLRGLLLKVNKEGKPIVAHELDFIQNKIEWCFSGLISATKTEDLPHKFEDLFLAQKVLVDNRAQPFLLSKITGAQYVDFFPFEQILAYCLKFQKASNALILLLSKLYSISEIVKAVLDQNDKVLNLKFALYLGSLHHQGVEVANTSDREILSMMKQCLQRDYIDQQLMNSAADVKKAVTAIVDIDLLISL